MTVKTDQTGAICLTKKLTILILTVYGGCLKL